MSTPNVNPPEKPMRGLEKSFLKNNRELQAMIDSNEKPTRVVAAIIRDIKTDKILIAQRKSDCKTNPLKWEFPGGKVEDGETAEEALIREIKEELNIIIKIDEVFDTIIHKLDNGNNIVLIVYLATPESTWTQNLSCNDSKWVNVDELEKYDFSEADKEVIRTIETLFL